MRSIGRFSPSLFFLLHLCVFFRFSFCFFIILEAPGKYQSRWWGHICPGERGMIEIFHLQHGGKPSECHLRNKQQFGIHRNISSWRENLILLSAFRNRVMQKSSLTVLQIHSTYFPGERRHSERERDPQLGQGFYIFFPFFPFPLVLQKEKFSTAEFFDSPSYLAQFPRDPHRPQESIKGGDGIHGSNMYTCLKEEWDLKNSPHTLRPSPVSICLYIIDVI